MKISARIFPILLVNFIAALGFSIVLPLLVFIVERFGGNAIIYGIVGATYPFFQLIGSPYLGRWSDRYGRRRILLLSHGGTLLSWAVFLVAFFLPETLLFSNSQDISEPLLLTLPLVMIFLARALDGLTGGNISVAYAYLADVTDEDDRSREYGKMSVASNLGFILGPAIAGVLGATIYQEILPVAAALAISSIAMIVIAGYLPESLPCAEPIFRKKDSVPDTFSQEPTDCVEQAHAPRLSVAQILSLPAVPFLLLLKFLIFLGFNLFYTAFPVHATQTLGWPVSQMGLFFTVLGAAMVVIQGPVLSSLSRRFAPRTLVIAGSMLLGTNFIMMTSQELWIIFAAILFFAGGNGIMWPSMLSLIANAAGKEFQGTVQGVSGSIGSLASIVGLLLGGYLYSLIGVTTFLVSAAVIYLVFLLSWKLTLQDVDKNTGQS